VELLKVRKKPDQNSKIMKSVQPHKTEAPAELGRATRSTSGIGQHPSSHRTT
jgi:hypothetical protein